MGTVPANLAKLPDVLSEGTKMERIKRQILEQQREEFRIGIYTDGGVLLKNPSPVGGTFAYCLTRKFVATGIEEVFLRRSGVILPERGLNGLVSNNVTELAALCKGILAAPADIHADVYSDSLISLRRVYNNAPLNGVPLWLEHLLEQAKARLFRSCTHTLLDGHPTQAQLAAQALDPQGGYGKRGNPCSPYNVLCDEMCRAAGLQYLQSAAVKLQANEATEHAHEAERVQPPAARRAPAAHVERAFNRAIAFEEEEALP